MTENLTRSGVATTELDKFIGLDVDLDSSDAERDELLKQNASYIVHPREDHVTAKAFEMIQEGQDNSFFLFDLQAVRDRVNMWRENLPDVGIYYSFKTNSDPELIKTMLAMGT